MQQIYQHMKGDNFIKNDHKLLGKDRHSLRLQNGERIEASVRNYFPQIMWM